MIDELLKDPRALGVAGLLLVAVAAFWRGWVIPIVTHNAIIAEKNAQIAELQIAKKEAREAARVAQEEMISLLKRQVEVTDASLRVAEQVRLASSTRRDRRSEDQT